jgi:hypothetical protein
MVLQQAEGNQTPEYFIGAGADVATGGAIFRFNCFITYNILNITTFCYCC